MADPAPYVVTWSFGAHTGQVSAAKLDDQFTAIAAASSAAVTALQDIRRDDGKLVNGIVTVDSLDPQFLIQLATLLGSLA